ncbi:hypothetical protein M0802_015627 [Mischocyttarus mexicanus]|nr:hypothetical protein M0802_015627 [Mischocyttarus mexicanus]
MPGSLDRPVNRVRTWLIVCTPMPARVITGLLACLPGWLVSWLSSCLVVCLPLLGDFSLRAPRQKETLGRGKLLARESLIAWTNLHGTEYVLLDIRNQSTSKVSLP